MTNSEKGNEIVIFNRFRGEALKKLGRSRLVVWGGNNAVDVDSLGSQNSLLLSDNRRFLFAVNNGSNEISSFRFLSGSRLQLIHRVSSEGTSPVSLAVGGDSRLLVLNSRGSGNIATFDVERSGRLSLVANGVFYLSLSENNVADMNVAPGKITLDRLKPPCLNN